MFLGFIMSGELIPWSWVVSGELGHATTHFTQDTYQTVFPEVARAAAEATAAMLKPAT